MVFGGHSLGYSTKYQSEGNPQHKSFVFKVAQKRYQECLHTERVTSGQVKRFIKHYQNVEEEWLGDEVTKEEFYDLYHGNYITDPENPTNYIKVKQTHNIWSQPYL